MVRPPVVLIKWADAHGSEQGWISLNEHDDDGEAIVYSSGFLISVGEQGSKKDHVTLWQTYSDGDVIHAIHIPVAMVRSIKVLAKGK